MDFSDDIAKKNSLPFFSKKAGSLEENVLQSDESELPVSCHLAKLFSAINGVDEMETERDVSIQKKTAAVPEIIISG